MFLSFLPVFSTTYHVKPTDKNTSEYETNRESKSNDSFEPTHGVKFAARSPSPIKRSHRRGKKYVSKSRTTTRVRHSSTKDPSAKKTRRESEPFRASSEQKSNFLDNLCFRQKKPAQQPQFNYGSKNDLDHHGRPKVYDRVTGERIHLDRDGRRKPLRPSSSKRPRDNQPVVLETAPVSRTRNGVAARLNVEKNEKKDREHIKRTEPISQREPVSLFEGKPVFFSKRSGHYIIENEERTYLKPATPPPTHSRHRSVKRQENTSSPRRSKVDDQAPRSVQKSRVTRTSASSVEDIRREFPPPVGHLRSTPPAQRDPFSAVAGLAGSTMGRAHTNDHVYPVESSSRPLRAKTSDELQKESDRKKRHDEYKSRALETVKTRYRDSDEQKRYVAQRGLGTLLVGPLMSIFYDKKNLKETRKAFVDNAVEYGEDIAAQYTARHIVPGMAREKRYKKQGSSSHHQGYEGEGDGGIE